MLDTQIVDGLPCGPSDTVGFPYAGGAATCEQWYSYDSRTPLVLSKGLHEVIDVTFPVNVFEIFQTPAPR